MPFSDLCDSFESPRPGKLPKLPELLPGGDQLLNRLRAGEMSGARSGTRRVGFGRSCSAEVPIIHPDVRPIVAQQSALKVRGQDDQEPHCGTQNISGESKTIPLAVSRSLYQSSPAYFLRISHRRFG